MSREELLEACLDVHQDLLKMEQDVNEWLGQLLGPAP